MPLHSVADFQSLQIDAPSELHALSLQAKIGLPAIDRRSIDYEVLFVRRHHFFTRPGLSNVTADSARFIGRCLPLWSSFFSRHHSMGHTFSNRRWKTFEIPPDLLEKLKKDSKCPFVAVYSVVSTSSFATQPTRRS